MQDARGLLLGFFLCILIAPGQAKLSAYKRLAKPSWSFCNMSISLIASLMQIYHRRLAKGLTPLSRTPLAY